MNRISKHFTLKFGLLTKIYGIIISIVAYLTVFGVVVYLFGNGSEMVARKLYLFSKSDNNLCILTDDTSSNIIKNINKNLLDFTARNMNISIVNIDDKKENCKYPLIVLVNLDRSVSGLIEIPQEIVEIVDKDHLNDRKDMVILYDNNKKYGIGIPDNSTKTIITARDLIVSISGQYRQNKNDQNLSMQH